MNIAYIFTSLDGPYSDLRENYEGSCICHVYWEPNNGRCKFGACELYMTSLERVIDSILSRCRKKDKLRIICSHGRLIAKHSDLVHLLDTGKVKWRTINGEWINRNTGEVCRLDGYMIAADQRLTIYAMEEVDTQVDITLLDIGNFGVPWDEYTRQHKPDDPLSGDDATYSDTITKSSPSEGILLLQSLYNRYRQLCSRFKLGRPTLTYSSQGNASYYVAGGAAELRQTTDPIAMSLELASSFGGRAETYGYGHYDGDCAMYDISAFYPHIATTAVVPVKHIVTLADVPKKDWHFHLRNAYCIANVILHDADGFYPVKAGWRTLYPHGTIHTVLHQCELERAYQLGQLAEIRQLATYESGQPLAQNAMHLISCRAGCENAGDKLGAHFLKCMANGWIGRLSSHHSPWADWPEVVPPARDATWTQTMYKSSEVQRLRSVAWRVQKQLTEYVPWHGSIGIAGAIWAYGRERLWCLMHLAGRENVLYVSTDSLIVNSAGIRRVDPVCGNGTWVAGRLRRISVDKECVIAGPGLYQIGGRTGQQGYARTSHGKGQFPGFAPRTPVRPYQAELAGGYDPETSPLSSDYHAVMARARRTPWTRYTHWNPSVNAKLHQSDDGGSAQGN